MTEPLRPSHPVALDERNGEAGDVLLGHELRDSLLVLRDHGGRVVRGAHGWRNAERKGKRTGRKRDACSGRHSQETAPTTGCTHWSTLPLAAGRSREGPRRAAVQTVAKHHIWTAVRARAVRHGEFSLMIWELARADPNCS